MLMRHPEHGWHNATPMEAEAMKKNGWRESSDEEYQQVIAAKRQPAELTPIKRGRKGK